MSDNKYLSILGAVFIVIIALVLAYKYMITPSEQSSNNQQEEQIELNNQKPKFNIETLKPGQGEKQAQNGDKLTVHYVGTLINGTKFDSSLDRNMPFTFTLGQGQVIPGWDIGLLGAKIGEKRKLTIPPEMGYGDKDMGKIPPNSNLIFEVEILNIQ